jgi:hypothetical protein
MERKGCHMSKGYYPNACLEGCHKIMINYTIASQSKLALLEYKEYKTCSHSVHLGYTVAAQCSGVPRGVVWGGSTPPKIPKFYKVEPDCKLSGKCLVFLFQHPNQFKNC